MPQKRSGYVTFISNQNKGCYGQVRGIRIFLQGYKMAHFVLIADAILAGSVAGRAAFLTCLIM